MVVRRTIGGLILSVMGKVLSHMISSIWSILVLYSDVGVCGYSRANIVPHNRHYSWSASFRPSCYATVGLHFYHYHLVVDILPHFLITLHSQKMSPSVAKLPHYITYLNNILSSRVSCLAINTNHPLCVPLSLSFFVTCPLPV